MLAKNSDDWVPLCLAFTNARASPHSNSEDLKEDGDSDDDDESPTTVVPSSKTAAISHLGGRSATHLSKSSVTFVSELRDFNMVQEKNVFISTVISTSLTMTKHLFWEGCNRHICSGIYCKHSDYFIQFPIPGLFSTISML